ncbi:unnamed protein product [Adineta ricciae]|uniref:Uncharacterized protein n=1 Tax=Adineta ricciae TaxID=249248 RepID=A0A815JYC0_ADIRI|nr:unnamed protein product [Adineta ricciae]CAF1385566.1 unnamed protein product [Adineta ricciae]
MSYEEIDKSVYGTDVFTNGAKGRYAKPELINGESSKKTGERKKRAPKVTDELTENGQTEEVVKSKKKSHKVPENGKVQDNIDISQLTPSADGETVAKPKKKRAPKAESNIENIDPSQISETEPTKKKKAKAPKVPATEDDFQINDSTQLDLSIEMAPKVKKSKKHKTPKTTDTLLDGTQDYISNDAAYPGIVFISY